ncbi:hypothetical protein K443DRAFT_132998 [Laccaria amethystina LaAM-08-1]|uniref:Chromatin modification-related protein n=1 Tax=Laccaria amethystina LaAM-08-1 TaxID=1095629 RepID=A0A0C9WP25_9AGAR|nr:hypothetical protein K443DRAFT_132998 [Laccaria amethystina LaAM-08-1]
MPPRKRKRSQAFEEHDENEDFLSQNQESLEIDSGERDQLQLDKERDVWDAFREEHFEVVEQLPLTLHRQFSLMRQLDEQAQGYTTHLIPTLMRYIKTRRSIRASLPSDEPGHTRQNGTINGESSSITSAKVAAPLRQDVFDSCISSETPTPMGLPPERRKIPQTTREMLSHIAWLSEELLRGCQEKVNLAQAAHDSIDRQVRLIEQAIVEQEAYLSQEDVAAVNIHLPDLIIPKWSRNTGTTTSSKGKDQDNVGAMEGSTHVRGAKREDHFTGPVPRKAFQENVMQDTLPLKITLPAPHSRDHLPSNAGDSTEKLYCYCNRVSFGEMIACDNTGCTREWFHLGCVGLTEPPEGEWFCEDCSVTEV